MAQASALKQVAESLLQWHARELSADLRTRGQAHHPRNASLSPNSRQDLTDVGFLEVNRQLSFVEYHV
jgi:hypothetical protein